MWRLSILVGVLATAVSASMIPVPTRGPYAGAVVMFGAHWCAPCMGEVRQLPELAIAAAPDRILLAWIDHPIGSSPTTKAIASLSPDAARRLARQLEGDGYGLPFSVMFDSGGTACAVRRSPLGPEDIAAMRLQCSHQRR